MKKIFIYLVCLGIMSLIGSVNTIRAYVLPRCSYNFLAVLNDAGDTNNAQKNTNQNPDTPTQLLEQKDKKLKTLIEGEAKRQGLVTGIMSGGVFLYSSISDLLLHPVLTIVLSTLTIGLLMLGVFIIVLFRREDFSTLAKVVSFGILYFLLYIDLLFIMYEQRKTTISFFILDKDILLVVLTVVVGYFIGRTSSRQVFEEKVLP